MTFKAALCPSCGGKLQLPDDIKTATCMYCGVTVTVQAAFRLAGRVKDFTEAQKVEKVREHVLFDRDRAKRQTKTILSYFSVAGLFFSLCVGGSDPMSGLIMAAFFVIFVSLIYAIRTNNLNKIIAADQEMANKGPMITLMGYEGPCPYCNTSIVLKANVIGDNCPACTKRIVIRDSKFYSVDTPLAK